MRNFSINAMKKRVTVLALASTAVVGGFFAINSTSTTASNNSATGGSGTEKDLAKSQTTEQQLMDQIRQIQKDVQTALTARTAAVIKYANATGSATLQVQKLAIPKPTTQAKTGASGGAKGGEKEFGND